MISIENQFEIIGLNFTIFIATFKIYYFLKHFLCMHLHLHCHILSTQQSRVTTGSYPGRNPHLERKRHRGSRRDGSLGESTCCINMRALDRIPAALQTSSSWLYVLATPALEV